MQYRRWFEAWLFAGVVIGGAGFLAAQAPRAVGEDSATAAATKAAPDKDAKKPLDVDPKPGPYPEDDLLPAVERGYKGSGAYRWLNVALQATAREHERHGARPTIGSRH